MAKDSGSEKLLYCSFCGKSQHEVRKLIAGPSVFICDECVDLCNDIIREEVRNDQSSKGSDFRLAGATGNLSHSGRVCHRPGSGEAHPVGRGVQPLQAAEELQQGRRGRTGQEQYSADRPDRFGQDAAGADAGASAQCAVRHGGCHHADRSRLCRRGRRKHHPEVAAEMRLRH